MTGGVADALTRKEALLAEERDLQGDGWRGLPPRSCLPVSMAEERRAWVAIFFSLLSLSPGWLLWLVVVRGATLEQKLEICTGFEEAEGGGVEPGRGCDVGPRGR